MIETTTDAAQVIFSGRESQIALSGRLATAKRESADLELRHDKELKEAMAISASNLGDGGDGLRALQQVRKRHAAEVDAAIAAIETCHSALSRQDAALRDLMAIEQDAVLDAGRSEIGEILTEVCNALLLFGESMERWARLSNKLRAHGISSTIAELPGMSQVVSNWAIGGGPRAFLDRAAALGYRPTIEASTADDNGRRPAEVAA